MTTVPDTLDADPFTQWLDSRSPKARRYRHRQPAEGLRFAFYGRVSTADYQDPVSSRRWQLDAAEELIAGRGRIVAEFFDVGCTRELSWADRPQADALLAAIADPDRGFDAIVVGEYERAFCGSQLRALQGLLTRHGVQLWIPETDGPLDLESVTHQALVMMLGARAKREVQRARFRTTMAMAAQAREQGRFLGGRPPYGYRLVDAGPHPNRVHAQWGRRLHQLDPDPDTAPHVGWIFAQRLTGHSVASIARMLNDQGVPCPSAADRHRNPHRPGDAWRQRTVAAILANPRYTGRQVWNRQRGDRGHTRQPLPGVLQEPRLTSGAQWAISTRPSHPALITDQDFIAAQSVTTRRQAAGGGARTYALVGLLRCQHCDRSLEPAWIHGNPCYRCRHGHTTAHHRASRTAPNLHLREDALLDQVFALVARIYAREMKIGHSHLETGRTGKTAEVTRFLHAHNIMIICGPSGSTLEISSAGLSLDRDGSGPITLPSPVRQRASSPKAPRRHPRA